MGCQRERRHLLTRVEPWLPLAVGDSTVNVAAQLGDECSLLNLYRRLLAYRKGSTALRDGEYRSLDARSPECFAFLREVAGERALVAINFSSLEHVIDLPFEGSGEIVVSTALDRTGPVDLAALTLRGDESLIIELQTSPRPWEAAAWERIPPRSLPAGMKRSRGRCLVLGDGRAGLAAKAGTRR